MDKRIQTAPKSDNKAALSKLLNSVSSTRQTAELMAAALRELNLRLERAKQEAAGGLLCFVRYFWDVLEPNREFSEGWALEAMAEHLEAVTSGDITRILINVPPGSCKSLLTNVFWPAWEWSAKNKPGTRYISFSYSSLLTERDNQRFMDLIESQKFQDLWGHRFKLRSKGVTKVSNDKHGWKFASSVRGTGTGERADRILCFPEDALVATERGPMRIGDIVRQRLQIKVWSRNMKTGGLELRPVVGWRHNPGSPLVKVSMGYDGSFRCTPGHRIWCNSSQETGLSGVWVEACGLCPGDFIVCQVAESFGQSTYRNMVSKIEDCGYVDETFCLTIEENHNFFTRCEKYPFWYQVSNCDDPHNIKEGESKTIREETVRWFREAMSNRLNHMTQSAIVVIMQRVHEDDVSGAIISSDLPYEHLMIPLLYESDRHCETSIGWTDPREEDGENYWPERMPAQAVDEAKQMGEFAFVAQYQQRPSPRGGGIFKTDWWTLWEPDDGKYPPFDFIIASCDPAYTDRDENDPCGFVILGVNYGDDGTPRVFLIAAWRKWLLLHGPEVTRELGEPQEAFLLRQKETWGIVEWIAHSCKRFKVDRLLIEAKASGLSIGQEMDRLMLNREFTVELVNPGKSDKSVRANRVQHIFASGMVYRPDRKWAEMVQDEMAAFPKAKYDDLLDAMTMGLWWLRNHRMLETKDEIKAANVIPRGIPRDHMPLYPM